MSVSIYEFFTMVVNLTNIWFVFLANVPERDVNCAFVCGLLSVTHYYMHDAVVFMPIIVFMFLLK